ncbi:MAG: secernin-3 [Candidatus Abyssobacteria bacterium SURF_17]|uniref:Dipeptidase n=1 Tax=Candidatus Abyssobacteria bacterium SURF_17 TaxID=2093361 RepID=A0A419EV75_9BACT|nr:MAG: secernin-3 [Candidatus Abyssubacteria bacterium SURF_17]
MILLGCDTLVALPNATADGSVIFAKNSDRPADESQPLIQVPHLNHPRGSRVKCQYLEIPQVEETLAFIGSRPHWLWGLEHGMNECSVAIGNEAVFTKEALPEIGLLGMDLVRLGLERGHTARETLEVMTSLLEEFGQGGSAFEHVQWQYNNSFLIADHSEAYILEASGRQYAWKKVPEIASISNHIAIGADWSGLSNDAISHAAASGWWQRTSSEAFDFSKAYRSTDVAPPQISEDRLRQSRQFLEEYRGRIAPETMMRILRDHYESGTVFTPGRDPADGTCYSICMHADPVGTTAASMVAHLRRTGPAVYWANLGNPCCGIFMPLYIDGEVPPMLTRAGSEFSEDSAWWLFKKLGEYVAENYEKRTPIVQSAWGLLEAEFLRKSIEVEAEAAALCASGQSDRGRTCLTRFMSENLDKILAKLPELSVQFARAS